MADDAPKKSSQDPPLETIFNSSIDDDWGEAFEAEDFLATPQDKASDSSEFFLPEAPTIGPATVGIAPVAAGASPSADAGADQSSRPDRGAGFASRLRGISRPLKIVFAVVPIALGVGLFLLWHKPSPPQSAKKTAPQHAPTVSPQPHAEAPAPQPPPHAAVAVEEKTITGAPPAESPPQNVAKPAEQAIRKKWRFPDVIVQAKTGEGQEATILSTDLTLVLKLPLEVMPPSAKDAFIREMIYQFYTNQPVDDLRRFALERGEMTRKLQSWIAKQWPGLPLDSVTVDRYQLL